MRADAKKVLAIAKAEGHAEHWKIQCDLYYPTENRPVAVLDWGSSLELLGMRIFPLRPELLQPSQRAGVHFEYIGQPIPIPADLIAQPESLTEEAFRRGFFRVE